MAATSSSTSEYLPQTTPSGPTVAPRPQESSISTSVSSALSPAGPPTPSSSSSSTVGSTPAIAAAPRPPSITTSLPANRMAMASVPSLSPSTQLSMTSKEWVIPPRPKPGRKPATDTPPTKRKAQNRAAQRAFRERRAARVGELEEELAELKEEHKKREDELEERIRHLEVESETLRSRCQWLQSTLEKERLDRMRHNIRATPIHPQEKGYDDSVSGQLPSKAQGGIAPRPAVQPFSISSIISPPDEPDNSGDLTCGSCSPGGQCVCASVAMADTGVGCGKCTLDSRCECLEALQAEQAEQGGMSSDLKRPLPPGSPSSTFMQPDEKRRRSDADVTTSMETDFTAIFSQQKKLAHTTHGPTSQESSRITLTTDSQRRDQPVASVEMKDSCGFCLDGSFCLCAESSIVPTTITTSLPSATTTTVPAMPVPPHQQQTHTPPPSDGDVVPLTLPAPMEVTATGAIRLPPFNRQQTQPTTRSTTCGPNGPGTCAQCLADPKSGLFCRSLAASFQRTQGCSSSAGKGGCCGGASSTSGGGCCKQAQLPKPTVSLSCADAYKTLASHRHFDEAAGEIGEWLPRLKATPVQVAGRQPIEVEAASIMSVLKGFDVRFGRGE